MRLLASRRGLEEKILIFIVLAAGLFGLGVLLAESGFIDFSSVQHRASGITGLASGEFGTQEELLTAEPVPNLPPAYVGGSLTTPQDMPLAVDLAALFSDPEQDELTFLATSEDVIGVVIDGSIATFMPALGFAGERTLTVIASDGVNILREPVKLVVEGTAASVPVIVEEPVPVVEEPGAENLTVAPVEEPAADNLTALPVEPAENNATPEQNATQQLSNGGFATMDVVDSCPATINTSTALTQNLNSNRTCLTIAGDNLVLDCAGFTIRYGIQSGGNGIVAFNRSNITIVSCTVADLNATDAFGYGINLTAVRDSRVLNNTVITNGTSNNYGISLQPNTRNNAVTNNTIRTRGTAASNYGILVEQNATNITIANNIIVTNGTTNDFGIRFLTFAQNSTIDNNTITADGSSTDNYGISMITSSNNNRIQNNTIVTRRPGFASNFGIHINGASGIVVTNNSIRTNGTSGNRGISLTSISQNNTVTNNFIATGGSTSDNYGIYVNSLGHNTTIMNNHIFTSGTGSNHGVRIDSTNNNNRIENNVISTNGTSTLNFGVYVFSFTENTSIINNTIATGGTSNNDGIRVDTTVINTTIVNNTIIARGSAGTNIGINLLTRVNATRIVNNTITTNGTSDNYGILVQTSSINNTIAQNNINTSGSGTRNIGIYLLTRAENNTVDNNTVVAKGSGSSHGILLEGSNSNAFGNNNVVTNDTLGYAVFVLHSNHSSFVNTRLLNASNWINSSANTENNNITNTTFEEGGNMIRYSAAFALPAGQDVRRSKLNLSFNRAFLNGRNLTFLNRSADITFTNIVFDDPRVLIDSEDDGTFARCPFSYCIKTSYAAGVFTFTVPGFTTYSTAEGNVSLVKTDSIDPAVPGELLTYYITVEVGGNNASNTTITDLYPPQVAFNVSEPSPLAGTNNTFILGNLTSGQSVTANITVLVLNGSLNGVVINNTVNISFQNSTGATISFNTTENTTLTTGCPGTIAGNTVLVANVSSGGTCVNFGADNIFLDCAGFTITYGLTGTNDTYGVNITSRNNTEVRNCVIIKGSALGARTHAIGIFNSSNTRLENNTIRTNGTAEADGIHSGVANTSEIVFTPASVQVVTNNNNVNSPYCTNASGVSACQVCFDTGGVNCANLGQRGCSDGEGFKTDVILRFNVSNNTNVTSGNIQILGGESAICDLNDNEVVRIGTRNSCGVFRSEAIDASAFRNGPNNLTCRVTGHGEDEDNGFKLVAFSYEGIVTTTTSIISGNSTSVIARNNTILADSTVRARGIFLDAHGSTVVHNNVTTVGGDQSHGIVLGGENSSATGNNVTALQGNGSDAVLVFAKNVTVAGNHLRASGDLQSVGVLVLVNDSVITFNNISTTVGKENRGISILASNANIAANNISVNAGNESHGIFVGGSNNTVERNNVTLNTSGLSHGIFLQGSAVTGNSIANNTIFIAGRGSDAVRVVSSTANTFADNTIINASFAAVRVERALNNVFVSSFLPTTPSALFIVENHGTINFTQPLNLSNATNLSQIVNISFNHTRVNTTHSAGQQLNRSAILQIFGLPVNGIRPVVDPEDDGTFVNCDAPRCLNGTYNQTTGIFQMNASSFSTYAGRGFPDCTSIDNGENQTNLTFTLETNVTAPNTCFEIYGRNVTLNCDNFTIFYDALGTGADGIQIFNTSDIIIKNCIIRDINRGGAEGIGIVSSIGLNNSGFFNNTIFTNGTTDNYGIAIWDSSGNVTVRNNTLITNGSGIGNSGVFVNGTADHLVIAGNTVRTNGSGSNYGFEFPTNRFFYGLIENNSIDAGSLETGDNNYGMEVWRINHTLIQGNRIRNSPNATAAGSNFGLTLTTVFNVSVLRNSVVTTGESSNFVIFLDGSNNNNTIMHNEVVGSGGDDNFGVFFDGVNYGNIIVNNTITLTDTDDNFGILMEAPNNTLIENNTIRTCCTFSNYGIIIDDVFGVGGRDIRIAYNNISACCEDDNEGMFVEADNAVISNNTVTTCCNDSFNPGIFGDGINATITGNTVRTNGSDSNEGIDWDGSNSIISFNSISTRGLTSDNYGISFSGNNSRFEWNNVSTNGTGANYGLVVAGSNMTIANNIINAFNLNESDGDGIFYSGVSSGNVSIFNNTITVYGNYSTGIYIDGMFLTENGGSITLHRSNISNISIVNNTISTNSIGLGSHGVFITGGVAQSTVRDNRILAANATLGHGIFLFDNVTGNVIRDNTVSALGNESYAIAFVGGPLGGFGFNDTFEDGTLSPFTTDGDANWLVTPESALNSTFGVRAGNMTVSGQQSNLTVNITLPTVGRTYVLQFALNQTVSGSDRTEFYVDDVFQNSYSSSINWTRITRHLTPGTHRVRWTFRKFTGASTNYAFIDNIEILPLLTARNNTFINNTLRGTHWIYLTEENVNNTFTDTLFDESNGSVRILPTVTLPNAFFNATKGKLNVTFNRAFLNSSNLSVLNATGRITLLGITFPNPSPIFDFEDDGTFNACTSTADPFCTELSYSAGAFVFNASHFTTFSSVDQGGTSITLTKSDAPDPVNASAQLNYTVVVNVTSGNASNLTLTDVYPPQVVFLASQPSAITGTNNTFILGNVTNGTAITINITVLVLGTVANGTVINNTANISFHNQTGALLNQSVTEGTTVLAAAAAVFNLSNISVIKLDSPDPVNASANLTYSINVTSNGNGTAFNVTVNDTYPAQVIFLASQPSPLAGTNNTFILGNLTPGTSILVNVTVLTFNLSNGTVINNSVNVTFQNETSGLLSRVAAQNTTVANVTIVPLFNVSNISVSKSDSPDPVENGTQLNYTITVTSNGNGTAFNVTLTEMYPSEVVFNTAQPSPLAGTNNTFILGNLTAGVVVVVNVTVNVSQVVNGTVINNSVNVTFQNETSGLFSVVDAESTTVNNSTNVSAPAPAPSPGQGGGSGGGGVGGVRSPVAQVEAPAAVCLENWACEGWSLCSGGVQSRVCYDLNQCNSTRFVPVTRRTCVPVPVSQGEHPLLFGRLKASIDLFPLSLWVLVFAILGIVLLTMASWQIGRHRGGASGVPQYRPPVVPRAPPAAPLQQKPAPQPRLSGYLRRVYGALDSGEDEARRFEEKYARQPREDAQEPVRERRAVESGDERAIARERAREARKEARETARAERERHRRELREQKRFEIERRRALREEQRRLNAAVAAKPAPVKFARLPKLAPVKAQRFKPVARQAVQAAPKAYPSIVDKYLGAKDTKLRDVLNNAERALAEKKDFNRSSREMQAILSKLDGSDSLLGRFKKKFRK